MLRTLPRPWSGTWSLADLRLHLPTMYAPPELHDYHALARYLRYEFLQFFRDLSYVQFVCKDDWSRLWSDFYVRQILFKTVIIIVLVYGVADTLVYFLTTKSRRQRALLAEQRDKDRKRAILQKLLTVITPTRSLWSDNYWNLAKNAIKSQRLSIPVVALVDGLAKGEVELRDPQKSLPDLLLGRLMVDGLEVRLESDSWLHAKAMVTKLRLTKKRVKVSQHSGPPGLDDHPTPDTTLYLDRTHPAQITSFIRTFQVSITVGSTAMLGFSARGPSFPSSQKDPLYDFAALPFLPRRHSKRAKGSREPDAPRSALRTLIPLKTTLDNVVYLLTSSSSPLTIKSVQNVSDEYATHLDEYTDR
ncbi:hypothetical protein EIP91_000295 [Steccherinum ochraceum]|uniref:Uncharacterized protein n=1 Tax=Steccherinum ochraceum TaxID=92696 RepID=A0A4R0RK50_9APHY|nr:hypothetical protein EIP91_000295 [Steccherinum ochraceum]